MRMNDEKLQIIGIENSSHRYEILKEIYKQVFIRFFRSGLMIFSIKLNFSNFAARKNISKN